MFDFGGACFSPLCPVVRTTVGFRCVDNRTHIELFGNDRFQARADYAGLPLKGGISEKVCLGPECAQVVHLAASGHRAPD